MSLPKILDQNPEEKVEQQAKFKRNRRWDCADTWKIGEVEHCARSAFLFF
jgi:hypothetical protein